MLDARSSQILLASNELGGVKNQTTLATIALDEPPAPTHVVHATFEDQLETVGWDVIDRKGKKVSIRSGAEHDVQAARLLSRAPPRSQARGKAFVLADG